MKYIKDHLFKFIVYCSVCSVISVLILVPTLILLQTGETVAQHRDVPFVPTPHETVEEMLKLANVGPGDYVIDLGSGDGRIVIAAGKRGAFGHGVDIDPKRISDARRNAIKAG